LLPERAGSLRARTAWADPHALRHALGDAPAMLVLDLRGAALRPLDREAASDARSALAAWASSHDEPEPPIVVVLGDPALAVDLLPASIALRSPAEVAAHTELS